MPVAQGYFGKAPGIARSHFMMGTKEANARDLVRSRFDMSLRRYGGQNQVFRNLNRYYLSLSPTIQARDNDRALAARGNRYPDFFVPRSFSIVEAATPPWVFSVLGGNPPVRVYARKQDDEKSARAVQKMLTYDWERSEVLYRSIHVAKQMFKYGTGIAKVGYKHDSYELARRYAETKPIGFNKDGKLLTRTDTTKQMETVVRFDGPWLDPISVYNFHPDPYYPFIEDMRYVCYRRWSDRSTLRLEDENHRRLTGRPLYKHLDKIPRIKRGYVEEVYNLDYGDDLGEAMGWQGTFGIGFNPYVGADAGYREDDDLVEIVEYWDRDDRVVYLANGETPIRDAPNPFDDKELPFVAARCQVLDNQFWGYGLLHPVQRVQEELNSWRNLIMRQGQLNILNIFGYDEAEGLPENLQSLEPGDVVPIHFTGNGDPKLVPLIKGVPLPPEAYQIHEQLDTDIQLATRMAGYRSGMVGGADTATEAQISQSNMEASTRLMSLMGELTYATKVARLFHSRRQQYLSDDGEVFRILGADGVNYERMTPEEIAGEYDFVAVGSHVYATKDVLRQQFLQLTALIKGDPIFMEMTDMPEFWKELWKMMDVSNPERFLSPPTERTWDPRMENMVMMHGEPIAVEVKDNHEQHLMVHQQGFQEAIATHGHATPEGEKAKKVFQEHMAMHKRFMEQQAQQAPPQEQPGMKGNAGNVPNLENAAPSQASLQAGVGGAGAQR